MMREEPDTMICFGGGSWWTLQPNGLRFNL
jgi:hypothetical protein